VEGVPIDSRHPHRKGVGKRHLAKCRAVRSQGLLRKSWLRAYCTARPAQNLCEAMPHSGGELEQIQLLLGHASV
jgi:hypothetical protein